MTPSLDNGPRNVQADATPPEAEGPGAGNSAGSAPDLDRLRSYTHAKLALATPLRQLSGILRLRGSEYRSNHCAELMAKLAEDRFTLAVLGQFKRGKSSLMNAIIGRELLPVGVLPLTSAITVLRFGPRERLLVRRADVDSPFPEEVPLERLAEFVTEKGNPGNSKRVKTACLEVPVSFLRRGLEFVDTPGVGSAIEANTATTLRFLPECDAVLFVTSVDTPFTRVELEFLQRIREYVRKTFFVVNKSDLLSGHERQEVLEFIAETIGTQMNSASVRVFPVSSRAGLAAKLAGDASAYAQSGVKDLEETLAGFLSGEKASVFLVAVADKALRLLEQESDEVAMRQRAREIPDPVLSQKVEALTTRWRDHEADRHKLFEQLRAHLLAQIPVALTPELQSFLGSQTGRLTSCTERLLTPIRWLPGALMLKRCTGIVLRELRDSTGRWLTAQTERLCFAADTAAREHWQRLESNLASIPALAASILGGPRPAVPASEVLPPWRLDVKFEPSLLSGLHWEPRAPWPWTLLPTILTRRWLGKRLRAECERLVRSCQEHVLASAATSVNQALDRLVKEVEKRAVGIGSRVLAIITGKPLMATALVHDGEPVRVDSEYGGAALNTVRDRLLALRAEVLQDHTPTTGTRQRSSTDTGGTRTAQPAADQSLAPVVELDLARDLQTRGCPVCEHLTHVTLRFFSRFQYDLACDEATQQDFAEVLGFCALHTWQLEAVSSPVGTAVGFAKLTEHFSRLLASRAKSPTDGHGATTLVRDSAGCHVCRLQHEAEQDYLRRLAKSMDTPEGRAAYASSQGVCLRHLGLWLPVLSGAETRFVLEAASRRFEQMAEDMQSFSLKTEALRRELRNDDERDAYLRALVHIAGSRHICCPWNKDVEV
jgi:predicted GTPase